MKIVFKKDYNDYKKDQELEVSWSIAQAFIKAGAAKKYEKEKSESVSVKEKKDNAGPGK